MTKKYLASILVAIVLATACGADEDIARWTCTHASDQPFCQCERGNELPADAGSLDACDGLPCCFASQDRCTCYGLTSLLTDCNLIQSESPRVDKCPVK